MKLTTKDAVMHTLVSRGWSKYRLAQELGVRPIMIDNYLKKGTKMGEKTATRFEDTLGIEITDTYNPKAKVQNDS